MFVLKTTKNLSITFSIYMYSYVSVINVSFAISSQI